jgi:hypothetical protein
MGAPLGNKNGAKKRLPWQQALKRSLTRLSDKEGDESPRYRKGLDRLADKVVAQALEGNKDAWQEVANRLEGKPGQNIEISGNPDKPLGLKAFGFADPEDE